MRILKVLTIAMGVLIVVATTVLVVLIARRIGGGVGPPASIEVLLDEPSGTRIAAIASAGDRLAVQLQGRPGSCAARRSAQRQCCGADCIACAVSRVELARGLP